MKTNNEKMRVSLLALAVQGALLAMFAMPQVANAADAVEDEVATLKRPENYVEVGVGNVPQKSAKFGEYNGLNKSGASAIANFNIMGGDAYNPFDSAGTMRWDINGSDLGTTSRALSGSVSDQGKWNLSIGYDELRHNISDTYQTPYVGAMGGNSFVLPAGFGPVTNTITGLTAPKLAAFNQIDISTTRKNGNVNAGLVLNDQWNVKFDYNRLNQSGAKLLGVGSMAKTTGSPNFATLTTITGQTVLVLPNPTNYKTDTFNLALNWLGDQSHVTASYFGSFFRNANDRLDFETFAGPTTSVMQTMSTAPNNDFHQLNLSGGHAFTSTTKLTGGLSYAKNSQNDAYVYDGYSMGVLPPVASLNGDVRTTHADLKLVDHSINALSLSGSVKFDERNNRTSSNFYTGNALNGNPVDQGVFPNTPASNSKTQWELAGDYRIDKDQLLKLAYNRENVKRWCGQYAASAGVAPGAFGYYPAGTNCVVAVASKDDKLSASYKLKATEDVNLNIGYSYSVRQTTSDPNAITARISTNGNALNAAGNAFVSPLIKGANAGDYRGFFPFFTASRKQQMLKSGVNWQANEQLAFGLGGKFTDDKYDSQYGVTAGNSWSVNLDADYIYNENGSISAYLTQEHKQRAMTDLQRSPGAAAGAASATAIAIPSGATWSDTQKDDDTTIGLGLKQGGFMGAKLDLAGDLTFTQGRTGYTTVLNYVTTTTGGLTCAAPQILSCGSLPTIKNDVIQLKLNGNYTVDKSSRIAIGYLFQQLKSTDYYYNGLQTGMTSNTMLPTNQQSPTYKVQSVAASYSYLF